MSNEMFYIPNSDEIRLHIYPKFWDKVVIKADENQCWEWRGGQTDKGYGVATWLGKINKAHRVAWSYPDYSIPDGMEICHSCDNPLCCNPKHLFLGTHQDNMDDKMRKGRGNHAKGDNHYKRRLKKSNQTN